jgi:acetylornithine/N-succinyldiaminopimelate aminotransferase
MIEDAQELTIARGDRDLIVDTRGRTYIDLFTGNGTVWLGHGQPPIVQAVAAQLSRVWNTGNVATEARAAATAAVDRFLPGSHAVRAFYSTGMEASEFAARLAIATTGRTRLLGVAGNMHGKSFVTSNLGWNNQFSELVPWIQRLPFPASPADRDAWEHTLSRRETAAVFLEPWQGSAGGRGLDTDFVRFVSRLCHTTDTLLVVDELLTGFYRTGPVFAFVDCQVEPDLVLLGKGLANGFPASAVALRRELQVPPTSLPGSTFAANPLLGAAVAATLNTLAALDATSLVRAIEQTIREELLSHLPASIQARGRGALWVLEMDSADDLRERVRRIYRAGVAVGLTGNYLRLLPALTIRPDLLRKACRTILAEIR